MTDPAQVFSGIVAAVNAGRILAYLPQMRAAANCPNGARSVSTLTWCYFALSHATVSGYSAFALHDFLLAAIFLGNCLACMTLVGIVCWKRMQQSGPHGGQRPHLNLVRHPAPPISVADDSGRLSFVTLPQSSPQPGRRSRSECPQSA